MESEFDDGLETDTLRVTKPVAEFVAAKGNTAAADVLAAALTREVAVRSLGPPAPQARRPAAHRGRAAACPARPGRDAGCAARAPGPQGRGGARGKGAAVTRWLLVLAAWVALELVVLYGGAWLAHKVVPPWAFSPTLLLNFVLLVAVGGAIFCHAISKPKRP
jgi:hypothetical protein